MDAGEQALEAARSAGVEVRRLRDLADASMAIELMDETWGDGQAWSVELIRAMEAAGNLVLGAFEGDRMEGFSLGFYADKGGMHFHSHMLAVSGRFRRRGIGYALKLAQRTACLDAGVKVMRWTFDPLQTRNATFNLNRLGAVADGFERDFYGTMDDAQSLGDRGDRLWARWDLEAGTGPKAVSAVARVRAAEDYWELRGRDSAAAQAIRDSVAEQLGAAFAAGLTAFAFDGGEYLFA